MCVVKNCNGKLVISEIIFNSKNGYLKLCLIRIWKVSSDFQFPSKMKIEKIVKFDFFFSVMSIEFYRCIVIYDTKILGK